MASFNVCVRIKRKDGLFPVYIRITHKRKIQYMRTKYLVNSDGVKRNGEVSDVFVLRGCLSLIDEYAAKLNRQNITEWDARQVKSFLEVSEQHNSFSDFARAFIARMNKSGSSNNAKVYRAALKSLEDYTATTNIRYNDMTRDMLVNWIASLSGTKRARTLYPTCIRSIFREAMLSSHEPGATMTPISYDPWGRIAIPTSEVPRKRAISVEVCRRFFAFKIPRSAQGARVAQFGRDVALLSFSLAAINTVDLYKLRKCDLKNGILCYHRSKTSSRRKDGAYMEMRVPPTATALLKKYGTADDDEMLLSFSKKYSSAQSFVTYVDAGIKRLSALMGMPKEDYLTFYTFRHTWATMAKNDCGASLSEVGFAMNHLQSDGVTRGYIKADFSPAWILNEKVLAYVFSNADNAEFSQEQPCIDNLVSSGAMVYARAYFRGEVVAEVSDIGFPTIDSVIARLVSHLPPTIPDKCAVQFRIKNVDSGKEAVYERMKGKGF